MEATNMFQCSLSMNEYSIGGFFSLSKSSIYGNTYSVVNNDLQFWKQTPALCNILFLDLGSSYYEATLLHDIA